MALQADMTAREWDVARLVASGATNAEIADELVLARSTVAVHVHHILGKLGLRNRVDITRWVTERHEGKDIHDDRFG